MLQERHPHRKLHEAEAPYFRELPLPLDLPRARTLLLRHGCGHRNRDIDRPGRPQLQVDQGSSILTLIARNQHSQIRWLDILLGHAIQISQPDRLDPLLVHEFGENIRFEIHEFALTNSVCIAALTR